jgi:hypothetical protein
LGKSSTMMMMMMILIFVFLDLPKGIKTC